MQAFSPTSGAVEMLVTNYDASCGLAQATFASLNYPLEATYGGLYQETEVRVSFAFNLSASYYCFAKPNDCLDTRS